MKKFAPHLLTIAITAGLGLASIITYAATSVQNSSLIFNARGIATFSNSIRAGLTESSDQFTFHTDSGIDSGSSIENFKGSNFSAAFSHSNLLNVDNGNSVVATGLIGPRFNTHLEFSRLNSDRLNSDKAYGLHIFDKETNPILGSFYCGSLPVSPVPEPAEYLLLTGGLALLGFIANRRRKDQGFSAA